MKKPNPTDRIFVDLNYFSKVHMWWVVLAQFHPSGNIIVMYQAFIVKFALSVI